jgi:hypothetical protein
MLGPRLLLGQYSAQIVVVDGPLYLSFAQISIGKRLLVNSLHVFVHVLFKTYKHQKLWNSLVINPILSSVFQINGFYVRFWRLKLCIKDHCNTPVLRRHLALQIICIMHHLHL